jgi:hypothetical protein
MAGAGALRQFLDRSIAAAVRRTGPESGAPERIERIVRELPHMTRAYSPEAIAQAAMEARDNQLIGLRPSQFLQLAEPIPAEQALPYVEHYKQLLDAGKWVEPEPGLFNERYLEHMRQQPFEGFESMPLLGYRNNFPDRPGLSGRIAAHDGRHRMMTVRDMFGDADPWLVNVMSPSNADVLPKHPYSVYPQVEENMLMYSTPMDLSRVPRFKEGGLACCARCRGK